ncbi:hypothetical protein [Belnapia sp. F-4-1]|uniref:hypothetical protein n=1 Tax=Belnapia sp. F-4-1 TaxID=1545443 RepID=UPI0005BB6A0C|nr:hypothetical protein [Belnapia sp. F-4-1]
MDLKIQAGTSSADGGSGTVAQASGDATAIGEETSATADVTAWARSDDISSEAYVSTHMTSASGTTGGGTAYAGTTAYSDITGDADYGFSLDFNESGSTKTSTTSSAYSSSLAQDYAFDIKDVYAGSDFAAADEDADQPDAPSAETDPVLPQSASDLDSGDCGCGDGDLDGNIALADIDAWAMGDNSLVEVDASLTAIEDQFSGVTVVTFIGLA